MSPSSKKKGPNWSEAETRMFLHLCREKKIVQLMNSKKFRHVEIFKMLVGRMGEQGFEKTPEQMKLKLKKLRQDYVNCKKNNKKRGAVPLTCAFYEELDSLFSLRPNLAVKTGTQGIDTGDYEISENESETPKDNGTDIFDDEQFIKDAAYFEFVEVEVEGENTSIIESAKRKRSNVDGEKDWLDCDTGEGTSSRNSDSEAPKSTKRRRPNVEGRKSYKAALNEYGEKLFEKQKTLINDTITNLLNSQKEMLQTATREQRQWEAEMLEKEHNFQREQNETIMRMFTQSIQSLRPPTVSNLGPLRLVNMKPGGRNLKDVEGDKDNN